MEDKRCPNCVKKENIKTKLYEFICRKNGTRCNISTCPYERDNYEENFGVDSRTRLYHFDY